MLGLVDNTDTSITSSAINVTMGHFFTPTLNASTAYTINFNNAFLWPHSGHNEGAGGVIASTGFYVSGNATNIQYFDDDGSGNLRTYYLVAGVRTYTDSTAGTVTYSTGKIVTDGIKITSVAEVDGASSNEIRVTAIPNSKDIVPVRNQILEIDFINTSVTGEVDTVAVGDSASGTTYTPTSSYTTTSSY